MYKLATYKMPRKEASNWHKPVGAIRLCSRVHVVRVRLKSLFWKVTFNQWVPPPGVWLPPERFHVKSINVNDIQFCRPSSFVYFPFGLGHRSCIGKHFALVSDFSLLLAQWEHLTHPVIDGIKKSQFNDLLPSHKVLFFLGGGEYERKGCLSIALLTG